MAAVDNYLHLFFYNYLAQENWDPVKVVNEAKTKMKNKAKSQIRQRAIGSEEVEKEFEKLYNLTPDEMGNIPIEMDSKTLEIMDSFDQNIKKLISVIDTGKAKIDDAKELADNTLADMNNMLNLGAQTGGLTGAAEEQLKNAMRDLKKAKTMMSTKGYGGSRTKGWAKKDDILDILQGTIQGYASGYMLEIAFSYSFLVMMEYGGRPLLEAMKSGQQSAANGVLNVGSKDFGIAVEKQCEIDPKFEALMKVVKEAINHTSGQAKADAIYSLQSANGQGTVSGTWSYAGFQMKNYQNISSVDLGKRAQKTLGELGITQFYDDNFLVNVAGGLAPTFQNDEKKYSDLDKFWAYWEKDYYDRQYKIDLLWYSVQNSMRLLMIVDSIAGKISDILAANINYYVVREKATAKGRGVRVVKVSKMFNKILDTIENNDKADSAMGVNWGTPSILFGKNQNRSKYWKISRENFVPSEDDGPNKEAGYLRSEKSYQAILDTILQTKISISLDFSDFFNNV